MATAYRHGKGWRAQAYVHGKRKGKAGFATKREAMAWAADMEREAREHQSSEIPDRPFKDALERYRDTVSIKKRGQKFEIRRIDRWLGNGQDFSRYICTIRAALSSISTPSAQAVLFMMW